MDHLFSDAVIELKILADRLAEGIGKSAGVFSIKYQILHLVGRQNVNSPRELIDRLGIAKSNLALACNNLVDEGSLCKTRDEKNKKEIFYTITKKGMAELAEKCKPIDLIAETSKNEKLLFARVQKLGEIVRLVKNS